MPRQIEVPDDCLGQIALTEPCEGLRATSGWTLLSPTRVTARGAAFFPRRGREFAVTLCASLSPQGQLTGLWVADPMFGSTLGRAEASVLPGDVLFQVPLNIPGALHFDNLTGLCWSRGAWGNGQFTSESCLRLPKRINEDEGWLGCHEWRLPTFDELRSVSKRGLFDDDGPLDDERIPGSAWAAADHSAQSSVLAIFVDRPDFRGASTCLHHPGDFKAPIMLVTESTFD